MGNLRSLSGSDGDTSQEVEGSDGSEEDELSDVDVGDSGILAIRTFTLEPGVVKQVSVPFFRLLPAIPYI